MEKYIIHAKFKPQIITTPKHLVIPQYLSFCKNIVRGIQDFCFIFIAGMRSNVKDTKYFFRQDLHYFNEIVSEALLKKDKTPGNIGIENEDNELLLYEKNHIYIRYAFGPEVQTDDLSMSIITNNSEGIITFKLSETIQSKMHFDFAINFLKTIVFLADIDYATIMPDKWQEKICTESNNTFLPGWITYLKRGKKTILHLPSNVCHEQFNNGGLLFWLIHETDNIQYIDIIKQTIELSKTLGKQGLLNF